MPGAPALRLPAAAPAASQRPEPPAPRRPNIPGSSLVRASPPGVHQAGAGEVWCRPGRLRVVRALPWCRRMVSKGVISRQKRRFAPQQHSRMPGPSGVVLKLLSNHGLAQTMAASTAPTHSRWLARKTRSDFPRKVLTGLLGGKEILVELYSSRASKYKNLPPCPTRITATMHS